MEILLLGRTVIRRCQMACSIVQQLSPAVM